MPHARGGLRSNTGGEGTAPLPAPHVLLLTGAPGIGKTTVIRRAADRFGTKGVRGFTTEEIRADGERRGFRLVGFDGAERVIAHVDFSKKRRVGKYGVDVAALDEAASLIAPDPAARLFLVDEIGRMECLSERFVAAVRALLKGRTPVVATVGLHGQGLIAEVKRARECRLWEVTHANRDELPSRVAAWLAETGCTRRRGGSIGTASR